MIASGSAMMVDLKKGQIANMKKEAEGVWCTFCNKPRHIRDKRWSCMESHLVEIGDHILMTRSGEKKETTLEREDRTKMMDKSLGSCSLAHSGMFGEFSSFGLNASDKNHNPYRILDSGATNHMKPLPKHLSTYTPCPTNKKISTADGSLMREAG
ncbi:hypothetical protein V8G54_018873 [Vigna mungo]|uniref:Uncharacterized protein n=1 Tax=Vigna mungo TaxID=3915 RepID=A0AAQ3NAD8_VIGMU